MMFGFFAGLAFRVVALRRTRLELVGDTLWYVGLGAPKVLARRGAGGLLIARTRQRLGLTVEHWIWYPDGEHVQRPRITSAVWDLAEVEQLRAMLGTPIHDDPQILTVKQLGLRYPGTLQWWVYRPLLGAFLVTGVAVVLPCVLSVIVVVMTH